MTTPPRGFEFRRVGHEVVIYHHGSQATTLRGQVAARFLAEADQADPQELMARMTGNYKRGNERVARQHPRNRRA